MSELTQGRQLARQWLEQELAEPPSDVEHLVDLAGAVGLVEDAWADELDAVSDLLARGRSALSSADPALRAELAGSLDRDLVGDVGPLLEGGTVEEIRDWLMAADELARAVRVLDLTDAARPAFDALADDIAAFPGAWTDLAAFAEQQEERGLGADLRRPLLRFWTALATSSVRARIEEDALPAADAGAVQRGLDALFAAHPPADNVIDFGAFRREQRRLAVERGNERLAADDSVPELVALPKSHEVASGPGWQALIEAEIEAVVLAIYGLDAAPGLEGPTDSGLSEQRGRWRAELSPGAWTLRIGEDSWSFTLTED